MKILYTEKTSFTEKGWSFVCSKTSNFKFSIITSMLLLAFVGFGLQSNAQIIYSEGFNSTSIPAGWTSTGFGSTTADPCEGSGAFRANIYSFNPSASLKSSSLGTASGYPIEVSFEYKVVDWPTSTSGTPSADIGEIYFEYSIDNEVTWDTLALINSANHTSSGSCATIVDTILATQVPSGSSFIARMAGAHINSSGDYYLYFDNLNVTEILPCQTGTIDSVSNVTTTSAELFYTSNLGTLINFEYGQAGYSFGQGLQVNNIAVSPNTDTSYVFSGLAPGFTYDFYMQDSCIGSGQGIWTGPYQVQIPISAGSSATTGTFSSGDIATDYNTGPTFGTSFAACMDTLSLSITPGNVITSVDISYDMTAGAGAYMSEQRTYVFEANSSTSESQFFSGVGFTGGTYSYNRTGVNAFNGLSTTGQLDFVMNAFRTWGGSGCDPSYNKVDNNSWTITVNSSPAPSCFSPDNVSISNTINSADVTISDTTNTGASYRIQYGVTGFAIGTGATMVVSGPGTYALSNILTDENYTVYVQTICSSTDSSTYFGPYSFNTLLGVNCNQADVISSLPYNKDSLTTDGKGDDYDNTDACSNFYMNGDDYVFVYNATATNLAEVVLTNTGTWVGVFVTDACPDDPNANCVAQATLSSGNPTIPQVLFEAGKTYYITVSTNPAPQFTPFDIAINVLPNEVSINSIDNPVNPVSAGFASVEVNITNNGGSALTSVSFGYTKNGVSQAPVTVALNNLLPGDDTTVTIGGTNFPTTPTDITAYITGVMGSLDNNQSNDTVSARFCGPISGTFTVGGAGADFASIGAAVEALDCGINGPIVFNINPGTYNEAISIPQVFGASATNTITFDGGSAATTTITFNSNIDVPTVDLNGADYVTLTNLTIEATWTSIDNWCVFLRNGANWNTIENCNVSIPNTTTTSDRAPIAASSNLFGISTAYSGNNTNHLTVRNNTISGGYYGIAIMGSGSSSTIARNSNFVIENNTISANYSGVYLYGVDTVSIKNNSISSSSTLATQYGTYLYYTNAVTLDKNTITFPDNGVFTFSANNHRYTNNMVSANSDRGIYLNANSNATILHNSVLGEPGIEISSASSVGLNIQNNIFASQNDFAFESNAADSASFSNLDYNLYFSQASPALEMGNTSYGSLLAWQNAKPSFNANSLEGDPLFNSNTDLHITFGLLADSAGTPVGIITDIDGDGRYFLAPDMGADEYTPITSDLELLSDVTFNTCKNGSDSITFYVVNQAQAPIDFSNDNFTLTANVTGAATSSGSVSVNSGVINPGDSIVLTVAPVVLNVAGSYNIDAYLTSTWDIVNENDSLFGASYSEVAPVTVLPDTTIQIVNATQTANLNATSPYGSQVKVGFWAASYTTISNNTFYLEVNDGTSWNNVLSFSRNTTGSPWEYFEADVTNYATSGTIQLRFNIQNTSNTFYDDIAIDDISVFTGNGQVLLTESFDNTTTPSGWSSVGNDPFRFGGCCMNQISSQMFDHTGNGGTWAWVDASAPNGPTFIGTLQSPSVSIPSGHPVWWSQAGVAFDSTLAVSVGPFTVADNGLKEYVFTINSPCGTFSDTGYVNVAIIPDEVSVDTILGADGGCNVDTAYFSAIICNNGANGYQNLPVYANLDGFIFSDTLDTLAPYSCDTVMFGTGISILSTDTTFNNLSIYVAVTGDVDNTNDTTGVGPLVYTGPPAPPTTLSDTTCDGNAMLVAITNGVDVVWYDSLNGGNLIGIGDTILLSGLTANDTLYAQAGTEGAADFKISERCHFVSATTGGPLTLPPGFPNNAGLDYIEISGAPLSDLGGLMYESWYGTSLNVSYTFPAGTMLSPSGTAIIVTYSGTPVANDPANYIYSVSTYGTDQQSGTASGEILKDASGTIMDVVSYGNYTYPAAAGVTSSDWSGTYSGSTGGTWGVRLMGTDNNSASDYAIVSNTNRQDPNTYNAGVPVVANSGGCFNATRTMAVAYYNGFSIDSVNSTAQSSCQLIDGTISVFATDTNTSIGSGFQYSIDGGATFSTNSVFTGLAQNANGYDVVVTDGYCTENAGNVAITKPGAPAAPVMPANATYCEGDTLMPLFVDTATYASAATIIRWYSSPTISAFNQIGQDTLMPFDTTGTITYYATQVDSGCEGAIASVDVTINLLAPSPTLSNDTTVCFGEYLEISGTSPSAPPPGTEQIGTGVLNSYFYGPLYRSSAASTFNYSNYVYLYDNADLGNIPANVEIVAIEWQKTDGFQLTGNNFFEIVLENTTQSSIAVAGNNYTTETSNSTVVYSNNSYTVPSNTGWITHTLQTPFVYNGGALKVGTGHVKNGVATGAINWATEIVNGKGGGIAAGSPTTTSTFTTGYSNRRPNIRITYIPKTNINWYFDNALTNLYSTGADVPALDSVGVITYYAAYQDDNTGCDSYVDSVTITKLTSPNAPTVASQVYCDGDSITPLTITGSGGTYNVYGDMMLNNQITSGVSSYTTSLTGPGYADYYVTEVNATGCESPAGMASVTINSVPASANLGADKNYCQGDSILPLSAGNIPGTTLNWYSDAAGTTLLGTGSYQPANTVGTTTYYASLTNGLCSGPIDSVQVTINAIPGTPTAAGGATYCDGDALAALTATGSATSFSWYTDAALTNMVGSGASFTPANIIDTVTYYVTQDANGCESAGADSATVIIHGNPTITSVADTAATSCVGADGIIEIFATGGDGTYNYSVNGGTSTQASGKFTGLNTGNYSPYVVDGNGCSDVNSTVTITAPGQPTTPIVVSGNGTYCDGDMYTQLKVNDTSAAASVYTWYYDAALSNVYMTGDSVMPADSVGSITYYVTETANGCEGPSSTVTVTINPIPVAPTGGNDLTYCLGQPVGNVSGSANSGGSLRWYSNNNLTSLIGTGNSVAAGSVAILPGTYSFYVTETTTGCESTYDSVNVTINPIPNIPNSGMDMVYCNGDMLMPLVGTGSGGALNWYSNVQLTNVLAANDTLTLTTLPVGKTDFWLAETNGFGCEGNSDKVSVTVNPTPVAPSIVNAMDYCDYDMVDTLMASGNGGTYTWYNDYTTALTGMSVVPPSAIGSYNYMLTETNQFGCESDSGMATVNVFEAPTLDSLTIVDVTGGCADSTGSVTLFASGGDNSYTYFGNIFGVPTSNGSNSTIGNLPAGTYDSLYVMDGNGCVSGTDLATVAAPGQPSLLQMVSTNAVYCFGDAITDLVAQDTSASTGGVIEWYSDAALTNLLGTGDTLAANTATGIRTYYAIENNVGCKGPAASVMVTVNALPATPTASANAQYCDGASVNDVTVSGAGGTYTWYSDAALTTMFATGDTVSPSITAPGVETLYVVETNANNCTSATADNVTITIDTLPNVMLAALADICENGGTVQLTGGMPMGGTWSADSGLTAGGVIDPVAIGGANTYNVVYTYTDGNGCTEDDTASITVNPEPVVSFTGLANVCFDQASSTLSGGLPTGGTYSGAGVIGGSFSAANAGVGSHVITYNYTDANSCSSSNTDTIQVYALPNANVGVDQTICFGDSVTLTATGGTTFSWSNGSGNASQSVSPATTTNYGVLVTDVNGCTNTDSVMVNVNQLPNVSIGSINSVCDGTAPIALLTGTPANGTYSGTGVGGGVFNPSVGAGSYVITYSFTDGNNCSNSATTTLVVDPLPTVTFATPANICDGSAATNLTGGLPAGGTYSGTGVTGSQFDPVTAGGAGTYNLSYSFTDGNGCANSVTSTITVDTLPTITWTAFNDICDNAPAITLSEAAPAGGSYSGTGVAGGQFDPAATGGAGNYTITYNYTDGNGCSSSDDQSITINPSPVVDLGGDTTLCNNIPTVTLDAGSGASYVWSLDGLTLSNTTQTINVDGATGSGTYTVVVTNAFGCEGEDEVVVDFTEICASVNTTFADNVSVTYYPNPTTGMLNVDITGLVGEDITLTVTNMHGQQVFNTFIENAPSNLRDVIDISTEASGVYFIKLTSGDKSFVERISLR